MSSSVRWTSEEIEFLRNNYTTMSRAEIAKLLGRNENSIRSKASYLNLCKHVPYSEEEDAIIKNILSDYSFFNNIKGLLPQRSTQSLRSRIRRLGLADKILCNPRRKYEVDDSYFQELDSFDKAYFLGLIWADGNVTKGRLSISLKESDSAILSLFRHYIKSNNKFEHRSYKNKNYEDAVLFRVSSDSLITDLERYGIVERKSYSSLVPINIPPLLLRHFIRGLFDGDGNISIQGSSNLTVSVANTKYMCDWLLSTTKLFLGVGGGTYRNVNSQTCWRWNLGGRKQISRFARWVYGDCDQLFIERKYNKFVENHLL